MKNYLIGLIILCSYSAFSQECGTKTLSKEKVKEIERIASKFNTVSSAGITYLPIKLHMTRKDVSGFVNDTQYYPINRFNYEFQKLNEKFYDLGYQFFLCDTVNYIVDNELDYFLSSFDYFDSLRVAANQVNNAINVYYVNGSNSGGRSNFPSGDKNMNWMYVVNKVWQGGETLTHEVGHYFNLYHTHEPFVGYELVNGSNCASTGDLVCDTPADTYPTYYDKIGCVYNGTNTDGNGASYNPAINNIMSYYSGGCRNSFTSGQKVRAQAGFATRLSLIASAGNQYNFSYNSTHASVPYNLRVFELNGQVRVAWKDTSSYPQVSYIVERSTSQTTGFKPIVTTSPNSIFLDENYSSGTTYYYRVKSIHATDTYSNVFAFTPSSMPYSKPSSYTSFDNKVSSMYIRNAELGTLSLYTTSSDEPYEDATSLGYLTLEAAKNYLISWNSMESSETDSFRVWIDYNRNSNFEPSEIWTDGVGIAAMDSVSISSSTETNFYRLRFRVWEKETPLLNSHDRTLYSETKDFMTYIKGGCTGVQEVTSGIYRLSGNHVITRDYTPAFGYQTDPYGPGYDGQIYGKSSVLLMPGFESSEGYENINIEIKDCE